MGRIMDLNKINDLIKLFQDSKLDELSLELKDFKITMKNNSNVVKPHIQYVQDLDARVEKKENFEVGEEKENGTWITAPFIGTYYAASSENAKPYVEVGQQVKEGDVLFILEAMKVMNEIKANKSGRVLKINGQNGSMVEYGQNLILLGD